MFKELDLLIEDGEFFTILGPSGCGKSTLLNIIAGLEEPTEGRIFFDSQDVTHLSPRERDVAMVFQSYALYPHMTVFDNIAFPLKMRGQDRQTIQAEVNRVARVLGLEDLLERRPKELSGGQRQRVALGRAIIRRPRVFLLDEPLSNLDARLRVQMRTELKRLHRSLGTTIVYVTHDQAEAMALSDRIAIMNEGVIQQCGTPEEVYFRPANIFVATFVGSPSMNLTETVVIERSPLRIAFNSAILQPMNISAGRQKGKRLTTEKVILGIRPEDIAVVEGEDTEGKELVQAVVEIVEPEGSRYCLEVRVGERVLKVLSREPVSPGQTVCIRINPERIHLFDPVDGRRITCI